MNPLDEYIQGESRRQFLGRGVNAVGWAAFARSLLGADRSDRKGESMASPCPAWPTSPQGQAGDLPAHGRRALAGRPLRLQAQDGRVVRQGSARLDPDGPAADDDDLGPEAVPGRSFSKYKFEQHGKSGMWVSELLPYTSKMVDDMCFIRSMNTEAINHEPAITLMQTGNMVTGRPCLGAWVSYGLGSANHNLPTFVVLVAKPSNTEQIQAISARLWQSGYLPGEHAGVSFRSGGDPILYINNPPACPSDVRRKTLDGLRLSTR